MSDYTADVELTGTISLEALTRMAAAEAAATPAPVPTAAADKFALVTVVRQGKSGSKTCEVEVGTTVANLMDSLGWEYSNHDFKMSTDGTLGIASFDSPSSIKFKDGTHMLIVQPKVAGGSSCLLEDILRRAFARL